MSEVSSTYLKFGKYMQESEYAKLFVKSLATETDIDKAFQTFARNNISAFTQENIIIIHDILMMMKDPDMKSFIVTYAKSTSSKCRECKVITSLLDSGDFVPITDGSDAVGYYLHTPSNIIVTKKDGKWIATGINVNGIGAPLDTCHKALVEKHGFELDPKTVTSPASIELPKSISCNFFESSESVTDFINIFKRRVDSDLSINMDYKITLGRGGTNLYDDAHTEGFKKDAPNIYIAGSRALMLFHESLCRKMSLSKVFKWKSFVTGDTDIFVLNSDSDHHIKLFDVDIVKSTAKTVSELLNSRFDLPPCQIAVDYKGTFTLTAHCLYSLLTGKYYFHSSLIGISVGDFSKAKPFIFGKIGGVTEG